MNFVFALVAAPLIGYFIKSRGLAVAIYLAGEAWLFAYEALGVLLAWMNGEGGFAGATDQGAFGPAPTGFPVHYQTAQYYAFGLVNLVALALGLGLTIGLNIVATRRRTRRQVITVA
ncbi:hypothetical protein ACFCX0_47065 [Streptomyces sp. NPDC056352]|uniref:hypothetical protein n=1 Tax=Streptomyces sp. NPDC056352 TaxID=3345791 RepID=UPI0035E04E35